MSRIKIGRATPKDMANMLAAISTSTSPKIFADCDVVIEAVTENEALKKEVYKEFAQVIRPDAIVASNTSTISITRMAESAPNPEQFIGMHFFSPVDRMELVEIIRGAKTSDQTVATIVALAQQDSQDADRRQRLPGLPGQSRALPLHEREPHSFT